MLEITAGGVDTYFDSALGFRHGPKAVLDDRTLVVAYVSGDEHTRAYDEDMVRELRDGVGDEAVLAVRTDEPRSPADWGLSGLEGLDDAWLAVPFVVVGQLLALHASVRRGARTDDPFPGGSVNRVVQGVTIHPLAAG